MPVLKNGSEIMIWKEKLKSRIRAVQIDKLRGLLGIWRMDKVPNARIKQLCGVTKKINEGVLRWLTYVDRMECAKRIYVGECVGSRLVGRPRRGRLISWRTA